MFAQQSFRVNCVPRSREDGFTMIELMVAVAIIAILIKIAMPYYGDYVIRSRLVDAFSALSSASSSAEQYWSNNRTYVNFNTSNGWPQNTVNFTYAMSNPSASTYTITATGISRVSGFAFTINQDGARATSSVPTGWSGSGSSCWVNNKTGSCVN
jgi:type IV pilus assembly protein PilE